MTRKSYIQIDGKLIDKDEYYAGRIDSRGIQIMGDQHYDGLCATDGTDISTRAKHREYMKRTGLVTFDDYKETFAKQQEARDAYRSGQRGTITGHDIHRAIEQLTRR